ncbi:MAG: aminopeptidase P family N-terminal domain-containing protein, partial [Candidatus Dormibacteraeota bacterium]|nr:aminopeptidase P family N-terminal domain-containing protein [Candidatus Dormibacteraeota bacterium]
MTEKVTSSAFERPPDAERDRRYQRLRESLERESMDGLLAYANGWRREQVRYLTGAPLRGSFALAYLPLEGDPVALAGGADREATGAAGWVTDVRPLEALEDLIRSRAPRRLGVAHLELMPVHFRAVLSGALGGAPAVSATRLAERVQMVKSAWELERVRRAGGICDAGWEAFIGAMEEGLPDYR